MITLITPSCTDSYCERLLQSVKQHGSGYTEIIVVDSGLSVEFREQWKDQVECIRTALPFNFSRAINDAVYNAKYETDLLLINDDCELLTPESVALCEHVLAAPAAQGYGVISLKIAEGGVGNQEQKTVADGRLIQPTDRTVCFVAVLIRRKAWEQVGPMDVFFVGSFGDDDFCLRARKMSWECGITGLVSVRHGFPGKQWGNSFLTYMKPEEHQAQSRAARDYFLKKWGTLPDPAHFKI